MTTRRNRTHRATGGENAFWLNFSDLMSALLLIFILVLFYIIYQYFDMYELTQAELARQQNDLTKAEEEIEEKQGKLTEAEQRLLVQQISLEAAQRGLEDAEAILSEKQTELETAQGKLTDKEAEIAAKQAELDDAQSKLTDKEAEIAEKQRELEATQSVLTEREAEIVRQKTQMDEQEQRIAIQQGQLDYQTQQLEALVGVRLDIIEDLSKALSESGINAEVDKNTGAITLESDVLFSFGKSTLSDAGKKNIDKFLPVYLKVLFSEQYVPYVAEIIIEGHTDDVGRYLENLELSQERAMSVANYVLADNYAKITGEERKKLREVVTANGRSYSDVIRRADGTVDEDASRRVVFKFRLTDELMIQQLQTLLENTD